MAFPILTASRSFFAITLQVLLLLAASSNGQSNSSPDWQSAYVKARNRPQLSITHALTGIVLQAQKAVLQLTLEDKVNILTGLCTHAFFVNIWVTTNIIGQGGSCKLCSVLLFQGMSDINLYFERDAFAIHLPYHPLAFRDSVWKVRTVIN